MAKSGASIFTLCGSFVSTLPIVRHIWSLPARNTQGEPLGGLNPKTSGEFSGQDLGSVLAAFRHHAPRQCFFFFLKQQQKMCILLFAFVILFQGSPVAIVFCFSFLCFFVSVFFHALQTPKTDRNSD